MPHHEDRFEGHDGLSLYRQCWLPENESTAVVILIHGFIEHSGRYAPTADALNRAGYAVYAMDLRGHGKSDGDRAWVRSFDEFVDDLDVLVESVRRREPGKPWFLFGHSMGASIAAHFVLERQPEPNGLVLSAPAVRVGKGVFPILRRLTWLIGRVFPRLKIVAMGSGRLSRDPAVVAAFRDDPLVFHGRFPVRIGSEILTAGQQLYVRAEQIRSPLLVMQGTGDRVVDPKGSRQFFARAGSADKTEKLYEGLYHDLFHEPEQEQVTADLIEWLKDRR